MSLFNMRAPRRPDSEATEFTDSLDYHTEFEDDESDMGDSSPRFSLNSVRANEIGTSCIAKVDSNRMAKEARPPSLLLKRYRLPHQTSSEICNSISRT